MKKKLLNYLLNKFERDLAISLSSGNDSIPITE